MHNMASLVPKGILEVKWVFGGGEVGKWCVCVCVCVMVVEVEVVWRGGVHETLLRKEENHLKGSRNTMTHQKEKPENPWRIIRLMNKLLRSQRNNVCLSVCVCVCVCVWVCVRVGERERGRFGA